MKETKSKPKPIEKPSPIMKFENVRHANQVLEWWKKRLLLHAWTIDIGIVTVEEMEKISGRNVSGHTRYSASTQEACIFIAENADHLVTKSCHEETLVHELLHLIMYLTSITGTNIGDMMIDLYEHRNVESLAKSFIMIKYDLPFEWFRNKK